MNEILAYYIDDQANATDPLKRSEVERYVERLSSGSRLICKLIPPRRLNEFDHDFFMTPDLFLVDYDLSLAQEGGFKVGYRGNSLASEIRTERPDCPIVLITRASILESIDKRTRRLLLGRLNVFDELILKDDLNEKLEDIRSLLISLVDGIRELGALDGKWNSLIKAMQADEEEGNLLKEAAPPLQNQEWIAIEASDWVRNVVLEYPGILYDEVHTATRLGISVDAFRSADVQQLFQPAKYAGVFSDVFARWWHRRVLRIAQDVVRESKVTGPLEVSFAKAFEENFGQSLEPAYCVWDCKLGADWVCYVLNEPVKLQHTLRYYPDNRPSVMDEARVSYRVIWGIDERIHTPVHSYDEQLVDPDAHELVAEIESSEDPCKDE